MQVRKWLITGEINYDVCRNRRTTVSCLQWMIISLVRRTVTLTHTTISISMIVSAVRTIVAVTVGVGDIVGVYGYFV